MLIGSEAPVALSLCPSPQAGPRSSQTQVYSKAQRLHLDKSLLQVNPQGGEGWRSRR